MKTIKQSYSVMFMIGMWIIGLISGYTFGVKKPVNVYLNTPTVDSFTIKSGTFDVEVPVIITKDTVVALDFIRQKMQDTTIVAADITNVAGVTFYNNGRMCVWLEVFENNPYYISCATHELMHVVWGTLSYKGIELSDETEEVYAYQMDYYTAQLFEHIKK